MGYIDPFSLDRRHMDNTIGRRKTINNIVFE